jgi:acetyl-CoA hydrolase
MSLPFPILTAEEAAAFIPHGSTIGFSGFTPAGSPKAIPLALARKARAEHQAGREFKVGVITGASTGPSLDGALAEAEAISFRTPYQSDPMLRAKINSGKVRFVDMHLSLLPQVTRYGFLGPVHWAVIEAADVTPSGGIVLTSAVGAANTYLRLAEKVLIELNARHPAALLGMHDIFEPADPPTRQEIPVYSPSDRIGSPICVADPNKIAGVVLTDLDDEGGGFDTPNEVTNRIGQNVADFLVSEMHAGRVPKQFLPLQSGVGNIANAVLGALDDSKEIPPFEMYTEVLQDSVVPLLENGRCKFASTCSLTLSPVMMSRFTSNLNFFRGSLLMRPQEISNHPEIIRRLGIISMNTAIEIDLGGNVNSTHVMGKQMMNGIGGSGDFTRNAYLSFFSCPSTAKGGKISAIVPVCAHMDHSEHSVQVVVTEQGVADRSGSKGGRFEMDSGRRGVSDGAGLVGKPHGLEDGGHDRRAGSIEGRAAIQRGVERDRPRKRRLRPRPTEENSEPPPGRLSCISEAWIRARVAISRDLRKWERYGRNPVIRNGGEGSPDERFASDPCVLRYGKEWALFYFGLDREGVARDLLAPSPDLWHARKCDGVLVDVGLPASIDGKYAHKPSVICRDGNPYRFYCALSRGGMRGISVALSRPAGKVI